MIKFVHLFNYLDFVLKSKTAHGIHSPFVYQFVTEILHDKTGFADYELVKKARNRFRRSKQLIQITDFGASSGNRRFTTRFRLVGHIARSSGVPACMGELLFRIVRHYKPENIIELGTSLGISTMYLSLANPDAKIITIEGCTTTAEIAQKNFKDHHLDNIELRCGEFRHIFNHVIKEMPRLDFAFIDGNHRKEPTLGYFNACLEKSHNDTILVFDDIYWSKGMKQAWVQIKSHPLVTVSIDLFRFGIVIFRKELSKEDFVIR